MPRNGERGGPQTRARIRETANRMFMERGYDAVTVADVAREAGVSSVTVFNHFPRKEDLFLDRAADAEELLREAVRDRAPGIDVVSALHDVALRVFDAREPLSGVDERSIPFFRTVADSPALVARAREIRSELERVLAHQLDADTSFTGDAALLAALFLAGYTSVMVGTATSAMSGTSLDDLLGEHRTRLEHLFDALRSGVLPR